MEKVLRINVGAENGPVATIEELGAYAGLGGRAMTTTVVYNEVPPNCHPLGPENKLIFSPGLMAGSAAASSGRISVGCKSPLTGTIKESNSGGTGGQFMARLGYAAIIIEGERKTDDLWKIVITKDAVTFEKCNEYRMFSNYPLVAALQEKYGMEPGYVTIGTAGEMLMCNSTICFTDPEGRATRHAGRGGVGAVMGSKGIKAIVLDPAGTPVIRKPKNAEAFKAAMTDALTQAGADMDKMTAAVAASELEDVQMDADVVVVGAGAAGLSAALKTAQNGHSVILLEKMGVIGGASAMAGSGTMATGSKWQKEDGYEDSAEKLVEDMMANGHQKNDRATVELFANTIGEAFDWLVGEDGAAVPYQRSGKPSRSYSGEGRGAGVCKNLAERLDQHPRDGTRRGERRGCRREG